MRPTFTSLIHEVKKNSCPTILCYQQLPLAMFRSVEYGGTASMATCWRWAWYKGANCQMPFHLTGGWLWQHPLLLPWLKVPQIWRDRCQIPKQIPPGLPATFAWPLFTLRSNCSLTRRGSMCTTPCSTYQRSICSPASLISSRRTKTTRSKWPFSI